MDGTYKVLFCGTEFPTGYDLTKRCLQGFASISVAQCDRSHIEEEIADAYVVIPLMTKIDSNMMHRAKRLKMIMQYGVGLEGIDIACASGCDVKVCRIESAGTGNAQSCAEHSILLALMLLRNFNEFSNTFTQSRLGFPMGKTLFRSTAIIFGYGNIGKQLLTRLQAFQLKRIVVIRRKQISEVDTSSTESSSDILFMSTDDYYGGTYQSIVSDATVLFLCCSQNVETVGIVNRTFLDLLSTGIHIINVARGGLFNYDDVHDALVSSKIAGLGIDVFHTEPFPTGHDRILSHPNVVATPHVAGVTTVSYENMARCVADNVLNLIADRPVAGCVNQ